MSLRKILEKAGIPIVSEKELLILRLLEKHGELFGLEIIRQSKGALKPGTAYVTLQRMETKVLVTSRAEEQLPGATGLPRRFYKPTRFGLKAVAEYERLASFLAERCTKKA